MLRNNAIPILFVALAWTWNLLLLVCPLTDLSSSGSLCCSQTLLVWLLLACFPKNISAVPVPTSIWHLPLIWPVPLATSVVSADFAVPTSVWVLPFIWPVHLTISVVPADFANLTSVWPLPLVWPVPLTTSVVPAFSAALPAASSPCPASAVPPSVDPALPVALLAPVHHRNTLSGTVRNTPWKTVKFVISSGTGKNTPWTSQICHFCRNIQKHSLNDNQICHFFRNIQKHSSKNSQMCHFFRNIQKHSLNNSQICHFFMNSQGTVKRGRRPGRQRKRWEDNIRQWTDMEVGKSQRAVENREKWRKLVAKSSVVPHRLSRFRDWWWWWYDLGNIQGDGRKFLGHCRLNVIFEFDLPTTLMLRCALETKASMRLLLSAAGRGWA